MNATIIDNKYLKVLVATHRAKQIRKGARPLVQIPNARATRIALEEVEQGLIGFEFIHNDLPLNSEQRNRADIGQNDGEGNGLGYNQPSVVTLSD